jgi:hypothetical protein
VEQNPIGHFASKNIKGDNIMNLNQESLTLALEYLDKVGSKIGMTADTIWPWIVRQQYVYVGLSLAVFIAACILVPIALRISNKHHPWNDKKYGTDDVDFVRVVRCVTIVLAGICSAVGVGASVLNLPRLFNPEFYALQQLIDMIK